MNYNDVIKCLNYLAQGYNTVSSLRDDLQDEKLNKNEIDVYFGCIKYFLQNNLSVKDEMILNLYQRLVNKESLLKIENELFQMGFHGLSQTMDIEMYKAGLAEPILAILNNKIEQDFIVIKNILDKNLELMCHFDAKNRLLKLTPIIKVKVKKALKEAAESSKAIAEQQKYLEENKNG